MTTMWPDEDSEITLLIEKGKNGILQVVFGRTTLILLMLAAQFGLMFSFMRFLSSYVPYLFGSVFVFNIFMAIRILNEEEAPEIKTSWIMLVMLSPAVGAFLYLWVKKDIGHRSVRAVLNVVDKQTKVYIKDQTELMDYLKTEDRAFFNLADYLVKNGNYPVYENTEVVYFPTGEAKFEEMLEQLEAAKSFIFMEYFILDEGYMWGRILNVLKKKVQEGVEVRVMYDGMCAIMKLPYGYPEELKKLGIESKMFAPILPLVSTHYNNRDHRKILVIDGKVAFTGGVNLADEYINKKTLYGHWKDTAVMLKGDAVRSFTLMFLRMWNYDKVVLSEKKNVIQLPGELYAKYLNVDQDYHADAAGYVIPYGDTPYDGELVGERVYLDIINRATRYVHIMTPYLILDNSMTTALQFAAKRGVDVKIILPHIPDKKYAFALAKTHYRELTEAGVKIYEYTPGFVHAKVFVSDDTKGVVGTINMDYRSLYLHFECAAYLYRVPEIAAIEKDFSETLELCHLVTIDEIKKEKFLMRAVGKTLKLMAPLM